MTIVIGSNHSTIPPQCNQLSLLLADLVSLFEAAGITYWLRSGNLLALIRNGSFTLDLDDDVDFGVLGEDAHKATTLLEYSVALLYSP